MERDHWTDPPLDSRRERLVALLYEELNAEEAAEVRGWLETDPNLREEWNELVEARSFLRAPDEEAAAPQFIFLDPTSATTAVSPTRPRRRRFQFSVGWVFALTTAALAVMLLAGLRVDRNAQGLVLSFGPKPVPEAPPVERSTVNAPPQLVQAPVELGTTPAGPAKPEVVQVSAPEYVTEAQLHSTAEAMLGTVAGILDDKDQARREELAYLLASLYQRIRDEENNRYEGLRAQIDGVGLGLLAEQSRTSARLDRLVGIGPSTSPSQPSDPDNGPSREGKRP